MKVLLVNLINRGSIEVFSIELLQKADADFFNYHAIGLLENLGLRDPAETDIDLVANRLQKIYARLIKTEPESL
jgi:hypothetical protein